MHYTLVYYRGDETTAWEGDLEYLKANDFFGLRDSLSDDEYAALLLIVSVDIFVGCRFGGDDLGWSISPVADF